MHDTVTALSLTCWMDWSVNLWEAQSWVSISDICAPSTISTADSSFILRPFHRTAPFRVTPSGLRRRADSLPLALFSICICYVCFWPCWPRSGHGAGASLPLSTLIWYDISELGWSKPGRGGDDVARDALKRDLNEALAIVSRSHHYITALWSFLSVFPIHFFLLATVGFKVLRQLVKMLLFWNFLFSFC